MNLLEEVTNFASLAIRIYGNIFAGEVLASLLLACRNWPFIGIQQPLLEACYGQPFRFSFHVSRPMYLPCCHPCT